MTLGPRLFMLYIIKIIIFENFFHGLYETKNVLSCNTFLADMRYTYQKNLIFMVFIFIRIILKF